MKLFALTSLAGVGLIAFAIVSPQSIMEKQAAILKEAKSLTVTYSVRLDGAKTDYGVIFSKPNLIAIDSPNSQILSDGKMLWEYNKATKTYKESEATPEAIAKLAQSDELLGWTAFFVDGTLKNMSNFQGGAKRNMKGQPTTEVTVTLAGATPRTATFYIDDKLGIARGFAIKTAKGDLVATADAIQIGAEALPADKFAFAPPAGATKVVAPKPEESGATFASVQGILQRNCAGCHGSRGAKGGYSVTSYAGVMSKGNVTPGDPDGSKLVKYLTGKLQPRMPSGRPPLSAGDIEQIKAWIKAGAKE